MLLRSTTMDLADAHAALLRSIDQCIEASLDGSWRVEPDSLRRLSGGASRETWSFTAVDAAGGGPGSLWEPALGADRSPRPMILQRVRPGLSVGGPAVAVEDRLLAAADRAGVPVPSVIVDSAAAGPSLGEARITEQVDGEALGPRIVRDERYAHARSVLAAQCGRALAAIHSIDPAEVTGLEPVGTLGRIRDGLDVMGETRPTFELALRWLHDHQPEPVPPAVVHGDFRVGNLIVDDDGLAAVLDWELAHVGDPREDLGWLCVRAWRFGGDGEVGGFAPLDDLLDAYAEATGAPVNADAVRWWIVAGTLTWGLICAVQARRHLDGHVQSVELATIGRRICETEYDLLDLLGIAPAPGEVGKPTTGDGDADDTGDTIGPGLQGRPTAAELVEAVRSHLTDQVQPALDGSAAFAVKVAANALAMVERELTIGPPIAADAAHRLAGLGFDDEVALTAAIRAGHVGLDQSEVSAVVRSLVVDRVRVANPRWLLPPDRP